MSLRRKLVCSYLLALAGVAQGTEATELSPVEVRARTENLEGIAAAGSEGVVASQRLAALPLLRPGEALEMVPGLIVTQHAGDGKANQYFLRGFNLDHGTDFATWVGGVPVNMPSHAHGQGYSDLNFLIPELVERIHYRKGPYFAEEGDFSSAGSAHIDYFRQIDGTLAEVTAGENGYARSLLAGSPAMDGGRLLYGLELFHNDGPWRVAEHYRKFNGVLRYSQGTRLDGWSVSGMAYHGRWTSTDQIAQRAVDSRQVDRFGSLDPSTGGESFRYSLAGEWAGRGAQSQSRASLWWLHSGLDLWSNFQYCLNDIAATGTCASGDQFKQAERRQAAGFAVAQSLFDHWGGFAVENSFGIQGRFDRIQPLGLYATSARHALATVREDKVKQTSLALWAQNETRWTPWFRSIQGVRADAYRFAVAADLADNGGKAGAHMLTPKLALIFGPWRDTEFYLNYGHGFHSNDARGTTIRVDPGDGVTPLGRVRPLVRTRAYELGLRSEIVRGWQSTFALWQLAADSELLFVGDAGTTEASRPSRRYGVEWSNLYVANDWLAIDADFAWSHARFRDAAPEGGHIPGAVTTTANLGITVDRLGPWFGALRLRYFGPRPLIEDNSARSQGSTLTNLRIGYKLSLRTRLALDVYNLFDRRLNDIEYGYASQLPGEAAPVFDRHIHPSEPRTFRLTLSHRF
ncbi:MAG: TonB-dependent receptor [Betaproteobacteria bacterium]|nr:TonB-dependent receptor [Betaproteobacteria bacterium]